MAKSRNNLSREYVLTVASRIFNQHGYHETSMLDVAQAMGITKGGLYYYVKSKEDAIYSIHQRFLNHGLKQMRLIEKLSLPPREKLKSLIVTTVGLHAEYHDDMRLTLMELDRFQGRTRSTLISARDKYQAIFEKVIAAGVKDGSFVAEDPKMLTKFVFGSINWMCMWYRPDGPIRPEAIGELFANLLLRSLDRDGEVGRPDAVARGTTDS